MPTTVTSTGTSTTAPVPPTPRLSTALPATASTAPALSPPASRPTQRRQWFRPPRQQTTRPSLVGEQRVISLMRRARVAPGHARHNGWPSDVAMAREDNRVHFVAPSL